jgi:hypothetical protein
MATITYTVTVATGTNQYGTGNKYYINGTVSPTIQLQEGNTYIFDTSDNTNLTHVFAFSTNPNNSPAAAYTTGVTTTGVSGNAGSNTTIIVGNSTTTADQTVPPLWEVLHLQSLNLLEYLINLIHQ